MKKELGFVGLGRMGLNMATRLVESGYTVAGYNQTSDVNEAALAAGINVEESLANVVAKLESPKVVWVMVPSSAVDAVLDELSPLLDSGDTIIDGGNSFYKDSMRRHTALVSLGINYLDCGTSGGVYGARHGASLMVGGASEVYTAQEHIFSALATPGGYARVGNAGAGHFVKMIHNGIEYGMMGALAEGVAVMHDHVDEFAIDLTEVFKPYEHESVIAGKLVTWLKTAYVAGQVDSIEGMVPPGETESEMEHITTIGDVEVLKAALAQRKQTRVQPSYLGKLIAAMRNQFGGHAVVEKK